MIRRIIGQETTGGKTQREEDVSIATTRMTRPAFDLAMLWDATSYLIIINNICNLTIALCGGKNANQN